MSLGRRGLAGSNGARRPVPTSVALMRAHGRMHVVCVDTTGPEHGT